MTGRDAARRERLARARLYVVTGGRQERGDLEPFLDTVLAAGADIIQLREKQAEAGEQLRWAATFRKVADRHDALFIVNDRPDLAFACGADGVHLGQDDLPPPVARRLLGEGALIGLSTHTVAQLEDAAPEADYVCAGPVHATPTKPGRPPTGLGLVTAAAGHGAGVRPWFAIGGIDDATLPAVLAAGAGRIVVVRAVCDAADPGAVVRRLLAVLDANAQEPVSA